MTDYKVEQVLDAKAELGECPLWSPEEQCLYWIDIDGLTFNRFDPASGANRAWKLHTNPGSFVLREGGGVLIAMRDGLYEFDCDDSPPRKVHDAPFDTSQIRFNDGRTDRQGRYWVGSMPATLEAEHAGVTGSFYSLDGSGLKLRIPGTHHANGTAFSLDNRIFYRAETLKREIYAYDHDPETGDLSNQRLFARVPDELGMPDGCTVDAEGGYWPALPAGPKGGAIARYTPEGKLDFVIELPVAIVTMPAFGGPDLSTIYVTTGRLEPMIGLQPTALSGSLFAIKTNFRGLPEVKYRG